MARVIAWANRIEPPAEHPAAVDQLHEHFRAAWPMLGPIFCCALRDRLVADARALDPVAIELLLGEVPPDLSSSTREAARNVEVRKLFNWLKALHPGLAKTALAEMLAAAGQRLEGQRKTLSGNDFPGLTGAELSELADRILRVLSYAPTRRKRSGVMTAWLCSRQIHRIMTPKRVEMSRHSDPKLTRIEG